MKNEKPITFSVKTDIDGKVSTLFSKTLSRRNPPGEGKFIFNDFYFLESPGNWDENRIDLKALEGRSINIHLEAESEEDGLAIWGEPIILQKRARKEWNVILISLDTLRADHLGSYGYNKPITPKIDRWPEKEPAFIMLLLRRLGQRPLITLY